MDKKNGSIKQIREQNKYRGKNVIEFLNNKHFALLVVKNIFAIPKK